MKFSKMLLCVAVIAFAFTCCKNADSNVAANEKDTSTAKEIAVATKPETASIQIEGMTCAMGCAKTIEDKLAKMNGVQEAKVDFDAKLATVHFDADKIGTQDLVKTIEGAADGKTYKALNVKLVQ
jgi:Cu+-exporting ATPase